nr:PREDICTED: potassium transporter 5-like [Daucus carota subsp. sativus]
MFACIAVTLLFRDPGKLGNAYGVAVVFMMIITSSLLIIIMIMIRRTHILMINTYIVIIRGLQILYLSAVLAKSTEDGYLPIIFSIILLAIMYTWNDVYRRKYYYDLEHKISTERLEEITLNTKIKSICARMSQIMMTFLWKSRKMNQKLSLVHFMEHNEVIAGKHANLWKKVLITYAYNFLQNNTRHSISKVFNTQVAQGQHLINTIRNTEFRTSFAVQGCHRLTSHNNELHDLLFSYAVVCY